MMHWLVRRQNFTFFRPMSQIDLIRKIEAGELKTDDEICAPFGYWFSLHEANEIRTNLGDIKLDRLYSQGHEDVTSETATAMILEKPISTHKPSKPQPEATLAQPSWMAAAPPQENRNFMEQAEPQTILKGAIFVFVAFSGFILLLISFWLSTY